MHVRRRELSPRASRGAGAARSLPPPERRRAVVSARCPPRCSFRARRDRARDAISPSSSSSSPRRCSPRRAACPGAGRLAGPTRGAARVARPRAGRLDRLAAARHRARARSAGRRSTGAGAIAAADGELDRWTSSVFGDEPSFSKRCRPAVGERRRHGARPPRDGRAMTSRVSASPRSAIAIALERALRQAWLEARCANADLGPGPASDLELWERIRRAERRALAACVPSVCATTRSSPPRTPERLRSCSATPRTTRPRSGRRRTTTRSRRWTAHADVASCSAATWSATRCAARSATIPPCSS